MGILNFTTEKINEILSDSVTHFSDTVKHITAAERTAWNGKAPGGYGLGSVGGISLLDANTAKRNGWYIGGGENAVNFPSYNHKYGELFVLTRSNTIEQFAIYHGTICVRYSTDGGTTWSYWEYVNPPMAIGAEYRTTERYLGKPVYVKLVDFGALPNTASKYVNPNISNFEKLIEPMTVTITGSDSSVHDSPLLADTKIVARSWFKMTSGGIAIRTMEDCTSNSAVVKLKYTKTTD